MIRFTAKQLEILRLIKEKNPDGSNCSVYDVIDRLPYKGTRSAVAHSILILIKAGYVERSGREMRDGKCNQCFIVTAEVLALL